MKIRTSLNRSHTCGGVTIHYRAVKDSIELMQLAPRFVGAVSPGDAAGGEKSAGPSVDVVPIAEKIDSSLEMLRLVRSRITHIDGVDLEAEDGSLQQWDDLNDDSQRYVFSQLGEIAMSYLAEFSKDILPTRAEVSE